MRTAVEVAFWVSAGLLVYAHLGYPALLAVLTGLRRGRAEGGSAPRDSDLPTVAVIVPAHDEEEVIGRRVKNLLALDYPRERYEVVVASDGSEDRTAELARSAGADRVLDLPRVGKDEALDAAVRATSSDVLAFSDANSEWRADALRRLALRIETSDTGYVCGQVRFLSQGGNNEEGLYWRYEMAVRSMESRLAGVTAGNGAINAVRRDVYMSVDSPAGHDFPLPLRIVKLGLRAVYEPRAQASELMSADAADEFRRKRRMMQGSWAALLGRGILSPRGYPPVYLLEIVSHRVLRYLSPFLHVLALGANLALLGAGWIYAVTLGLQIGLLVAAGLGGVWRWRPLRVAHYYVAVTAASALGLWDYLRHGVPRTWEKVAGTR